MDHETNNEINPLLEMAKGAKENMVNTEKDLSVNHDRYLMEIYETVQNDKFKP